MYKNIFHCILIFFFSTACLSVQALQNTDPQIKWFESFFSEKKQKGAEKLLKESATKLKKASLSKEKATEAKLNKEIGLLHLSRYDYAKAMDYLVLALGIEDSLNTKAEQIFSYIAIARVFEEIGDYGNSAQALEVAIALNEPFANIEVLVYATNRLGMMHAAQGKYDAAFENFDVILKHKNDVASVAVEAEALFHKGNLYTVIGKYNEALKTHKKALDIWRNAKYNEREAKSLNDIGELYRLMKNNERVKANHVLALEIRERIKDKKGIAESLNNLGLYYFDQKNYDSAIFYFEAGLVKAQEAKAQHQMGKSNDYLGACYKELGDYQRALEYIEAYVGINELIQGENNDRKITATQNRYEIAKRQSQIDKLDSIRKQRERELQAQKKIRNFLYLAVSLSLIVAGLIVYLYIIKQRSNKKLTEINAKVNHQNTALQELNATKDKFFSIISHDLRGPLNSLTSFSNLLINYYESLSKEEVQMLARDFDKSLKNLFALLENLLEWSRSQTGNIEFKPEPFDLAGVLEENRTLLSAQAQHKKITLTNTSTEAFPIAAHKHSINTVIRNLISNAIKFTPEGGAINFGLKQNGKDVVVSIQDNGLGIPPQIVQKLFKLDTKHSTKGTADEKGTGLGLILCKEFIEKNGGRIWVQSEVGKGSVFSFSLPVNIGAVSKLRMENVIVQQ